MPSGGYREPESPAPASGPGRLSRRTDGGPAQKIRDLPDAAYGENAVYQDLQRQAPLSASPPQSMPTGGAGAPGGMTPFGDPTQNPDQPVTSGAEYGDGPGTEALGLPQPVDQDLAAYAPYVGFMDWLAA